MLKPYGRQLASLGIRVDPKGHSARWLTRLHSVLNRDGETVPAALQSAFMEIADLATELGHEMIVTQAIERGVDLFAVEQTMSRQDLAFYVYDVQPDVFRAAHARLQPQNAPNFVEFYGDGSAVLAARRIQPQLAGLGHRLSAHFQARNRSTFCRVLCEELGGEIAFIFIRGGAPQAVTSVHPVHGQLLTYVPEQCDIVLYHRDTDRLSICTPYPTDQRNYRAMMGLVLALDEEYFRALTVFRGEPLMERGSAALDIGGISGLDRVSLRKITLLGRDELESSLHFASDDLGSWLDHGPLRVVLQQRPIGAWTFGVFMGQNAAPGEVDILPPNQLRFDRRVPLRPLREFMARQGFLRPPPRR